MFDVLIILAGGVNLDGTLPEVPKLRVQKGVELFKNGEAAKIIMSGRWGFWSEKDFPKTEAQAMKEYAMELGVPEEAILIEDESKDTIGNAYFSRVRFLDPHNWKKVLIVTSEYHISRAKIVFDKVLGPEFQIEYVGVDSKLLPEELAKRLAKENKTNEVLNDWVKDIPDGDAQKIYDVMYTKHPGYAENPEFSKEQLLKMLGRV
jgi:uncharacterized SAM-binding protein YcdF (DUF218 family)